MEPIFLSFNFHVQTLYIVHREICSTHSIIHLSNIIDSAEFIEQLSSIQFTDVNKIVSYMRIITLKYDFQDNLKALTSPLYIVLYVHYM